PLTDAGRRQAESLGARLGAWDFARVLSSPMSRALETCRLAGFGDRAELTDDLREWDYGEYDGRRTVDIREERPGWTVWRDGAPGGETAPDVGRRADRVLEAARHAGGDVVLFAHGHLLRVLGARWIDLPPDYGARLGLSTATLSVLGWERETAVIHRWNDVNDVAET
ncbi:MAG TPA: histidine phosphatase family protein, partial [Acidimicrobiales bacterium]|nr:histidine phosphatase family protein [Acidimicrobiales bacterium]